MKRKTKPEKVLVVCQSCLSPLAYISGLYPIEPHTCLYCQSLEKPDGPRLLKVVK